MLLRNVMHHRALAAIVAVSGLAGAGVAANHLAHENPTANIRMATDDGPSRTGFAPIVKKVTPTVVKIESTKMSKISDESAGLPEGMPGDLGDNPLFRQFFGQQGGNRRSLRQMPQQRERGVGSGVVMTPDGYILTNNHVVDGANTILVTMSDGREFKGTVVGADAKSDIAVVKIDATNLPSITVADSSKIQVGDYALAVGNPFGIGQTVTMGIVSATGRTHLGIEEYEDFIQTDAPINPGNSGGALVNDRGELIGINTAILANGSNGNQGVGFAVPANEARLVMEQLVTNGKVSRAYLGVVPQDMTPAIAKAFGQKDTLGALIGDVSTDGPAQKAGLQKGDIVREINGKPVSDANQLRMTISMMRPDTTVKVGVIRNGAQHDFNVQLGELEDKMASAKPASDKAKSSLSGVSVENLDAEAAHDLHLAPNTQGVVVTQVDPGSAAAEAGLRRGDVIQEVDHKAVKNSSDFEHAFNGSKQDTLLLVNRNGNTLYIAA